MTKIIFLRSLPWNNQDLLNRYIISFAFIKQFGGVEHIWAIYDPGKSVKMRNIGKRQSGTMPRRRDYVEIPGTWLTIFYLGGISYNLYKYYNGCIISKILFKENTTKHLEDKESDTVHLFAASYERHWGECPKKLSNLFKW